MTELKLVRGAAGWLRGIGLLFSAIALSLVIMITVLEAAESSTQPGSDSKIDYSISFNTTATAGEVAQNESPSTFPAISTDGTWELWLRPMVAPPYGAFQQEKHILTKELSFNFAIWPDGNFHYELHSGSAWQGWQNTNVAFQLGAWQHIAFVKTGTTLEVYQNGQLASTLTSGVPVSLGSNSNVFSVGHRDQYLNRISTPDALGFQGFVDEVRVWNTARSAAQIAEWMHKRVSSEASGLLGYWDFNETDGSRVHNRAKNPVAGSDLLLKQGSSKAGWNPTRLDVKQVSSVEGGDTVITFPRTYLPGVGVWEAPAISSNVQALVVAGGGSGGSYAAGGGGGGGVLASNFSTFEASSYAIVVGQGGSPTGSNSTLRNARNRGKNGQASLAFGLATVGGGAGGHHSEWSGLEGGSGGGGGSFNSGIGVGGAGVEGQGFRGGNAIGPRPTNFTAGAGGGGAGGVGGDASDALNRGGDGGPGIQSAILGVNRYFGGGGGGGTYWGGSTGVGRPGNGGLGGGGGGSAEKGSEVGAGGGSALSIGGSGTVGDFSVAGSGGANTGGGGGGVGHDGISGAGGSGVVIVRYTPTVDLAFQPSANNQLQGSSVIPVGIGANFSMEAWVYPTDLSGWKSVINQSRGFDSPSERTFLGLNNGELSGWLNGGSPINTGYMVQPNRWTHLAVTATQGGAVRFYANGVMVRETLNYSRDFTLGPAFSIAGSHVSDEFFVGSIDQVKVWGAELSPAEVALSMHTYSTSGIAKSLLAHYDFNEHTEGVEINRADTSKNLTSSAVSTQYSDSRIIESGTAHTTQNYVKFNRSYLTANGGWISPSGISRFQTLVVGGGGGGGGRHGGGGGAGGFIESQVTLSSSAQEIVVGTGGSGSPFLATNTSIDSTQARAQRGGDSSAFGQTVLGGGAGLGKATDSSSTSGGSGGGTDANSSFTTAGGGESGQGNPGGYGDGGSTGQLYTGGGGGGAASAGANVVSGSGQGGKGGDGRGSSITGSQIFYAGGGGGASGGTNLTGGLGGTGGGGAGGGIGGSSGTSGTDGVSGTGGGGGGGGHDSSVWAYRGGSGGSGVVIVSWGRILDVAQEPSRARAGTSFADPIKIALKDSDGTTDIALEGVEVTVTAPAGVLQLNNQSVPSATATTDSSGIATFSNLGFQSGVSSAQTLTFTSDAFVGTTLSVSPTFLPTQVTISTGTSSNGSFIDGYWISTSNTASVINATDLAAQLALRDVTIETFISNKTNTDENFGSVTFGTNVVKSAGLDQTLTIKAQKNIRLRAQSLSSTSGKLNVALWADSDSTSGGGVSLHGTATTYAIDSNGGHVAIGGGSNSETWNGIQIPAGYAQSNSDFSSDWYGVELGINQNTSGLKLIRTSGGNLRIYGDANSPQPKQYGIAWEGGEINTGSGSVELNGKTSRDTLATGGENYGVGIGAHDTSQHDIPRLITTGSVTITGTTGGNYTKHEGVFIRNSIINAGTSQVTISTNRRVQFAAANSFSSRVNVTSAGRVIFVGAQAFNGSSDGVSAEISSSAGNLDIQGAISSSASLNFSCSAGTYASNASGSISSGGAVSVDCASVTHGAALSSVSGVELTSGGSATINANLLTSSATDPLIVKAQSSISVAANLTLQTAGSDLVLWASSSGGNGSMSFGNSVCMNTNASCDALVSIATGNIILGGGAAGTSSPTGPVVSTTAGVNGISFGTAASNIKVLSGGGNISMRASSAQNGLSFWSGFELRSTTGSITLEGSSSAASSQGVRIGGAGSSSISSAKTSGDAITITGSNGSASATAGSNGVGFASSVTAVTLSASGGGDVRINGTVSPTASVQGSQLFNTTINSVGGDILFAGDWAELNSSRLDASSGGAIQIKSTRHVGISSSTLETSGPLSGSGGEISIWSDSDGNNEGVIHTSGVTCINTINSCTTPTSSGGAGIVLGGGSLAAANSFFPAGGAPAGSMTGIRLSEAHSANGTKIWSGGGDITLTSKTGTASAIHGQYWHGGTNIDSGLGQVRVTNNAGAATANQTHGIYLESTGHPISVTSAKGSGDAIKFVSSLLNSGDGSQPIRFWGGTNSVRNTISATGGGNVYLEGNASGTGANTYSLDLSNTDILSPTGKIDLKGNRGVGWNRFGSGSTNLGSLAGGSATGNIVIEGNRFTTTSTWPLNFRTNGTLAVKPMNGEAFLAPTTFPAAGTNLVGLTGLTVGAPSNTEGLTVGAAASVAGPITYEGGAFTGSAEMTSTGTGLIKILSSSTANLNADITSGSGGILVKSSGRITTSTGDSVAAPRKITTNSGPITLWTTGAAGGVTLNNYVHLNSNSSGAGGADITIGGGSADDSDSTIPGDNAASNANSGIILGTSNVDQIVKISAGTGDVAIRGESTSSSSTQSGIDMMAGVKITGGTVDLFGKANNTSATDNTAAGIFHYQDSTTAKTLIEATKGFASHADAISVRGESTNGHYGMMLGNAVSGSTNEAVTIRTTGAKADIKVSGSTGAADKYAFMAAGVTFSTATGNLTLDSGDDRVALSRNTTTRQFVFTPVAGQPGGDITVRTKDLNTFSSGSWDVVTAGTLTLEPPTGQSFEVSTTFPLADSAINVGKLFVGSSNNTQSLTAGMAVSSAGDVTYMGGSFEQVTGATLTSTGANGVVRIVADTATITQNLLSADGIVAIEPRTANRGIEVGGSSSTVLRLTPTQLQSFISAKTLRLGNSDTTGNVVFNSSLNLTGKVQNLAIRSAGNVSGAAGVVITVANLGIDAGGTINFPGNQVASTIALQGSTITYNQIANYAVAAVDGIDPEFGYGVRFAIASVPVSGTLDGFMAVAFNPPPTVTIRDKFGNTLATNNTSAADYSVSTAFTLATTTSGTPVASGTAPTRSGGTFTFSDLKVVDGTGTGTFTFSATRGNTALSENSQFVDGASFVTQSAATFTTATYNIQAGEPASIALSFTATSAPTGKTGLAPTATLKDVGGNTIVSGPHANATITIAIAGSDGTIVSGATATTVNGVASFPNLILGGKVNTNYTLTFSVTFQNTQSQPVTVTKDEVVTLTFGDPTKLTLGAATQTVANRTSLANIVATIRDAYDNVVTNSTAAVALSFGAGATLAESAVVTGYSAQNATAGVATFTGISLAAKVDDYTVTASSGSLATASQVVTVTHGEAHSITLTAPATATNDVVFGAQPVVRILDQEGNLVTSDSQSTQTVTLSATGATLGGTVSMPAVAGQADFTGKLVKLTGTIGSVTLKAAITSPITIEDTETITLGFGSATKLAITQAAAGFVNRTNFTTQPKVTVQDVSGNTVTNFAGNVELSIGAGASITGTRTLTLTSAELGVASFLGLGLQGTIGTYTITASSTNLTSATQTGVALTHGEAAKVVVIAPTNAQSNIVFGTQPMVEILDADDNPVTTGPEATQVVTLTATGATLSGTNAQSLAMAAVAGEADFTGKGLKLEGELGTKTLTAAISSPSSISGNASIELGFGEAVKLAITQAAAGFVNRTNFTNQPKVTVQDVSGNTVTNFTGEVALSIGSGASITGDIDLTLVAGDLGVASFSGLGLQGTIGSYTITASSSGLTSATQTGIALTHGAAASVELTIPATVTNDAVFGVQPQARILDADGNLVSTGTESTQDVVLSSSNATIAGTLTQPAVGGVADFTGIKLTSTIGSRSVTATISDPSATDTETTTVTFGSATKLAITQAAAGFVNRTNFTTQPKVTVQDVSGNTVTNFAGTIGLAVSAGATLTGTTSVTISGTDLGVASFSGVGIFGPIATYTLTFSSGALANDTQSAAITHGEAHSLQVTAPATATNDVVFGTQPVVRILDRDGNLVTTGPQSEQTVTLSATGAVLDGTVSMAAVAGEANFTGKDLKLTGLIGPKPLKASISSPETIEETATITLQFGAATQLALTQAAAGFVNRTDFTTQPIVEVRDVSGNAVTNYSGTVAIGVGSGVTFSGTPSVVLNGTQSGLASFTGLGLYGTVGSYTLTYSSGSLTTATQSVNLTHGVATQLSVTTEADGARAGIVFDDQPVVKVLDQDSNLVLTGDAATSNIRVQSSGATLSGTLTALAEGGIATFSGLKLSGTVGTYQISYSALSPALAAGFTTQTHDIELAPGVATEIHVTEQPSAVFAGEALDPVVSVQLRDDWQNVVTTDSTSTVKPVLVDATTEAVIDSSVAATAVTNGAVSFTGLSFTSAGQRKIQFESGAITKLSDSFTITHAAASQIVWTSTEPSSMRNEIELSPAPSFEIRDQFGNPALSGPRFTVTASVVGGNSANVLALAGETISQASASAAITFPALSVKAPEDDYQLRFTAVNGATSFSVDSAAIPLTFGVPTQLSIETAAATAGAGLAFGTQPVVHILDSAGNLVADSTLNVTASVAGRDLVGSATITAASGIANFANSGLGINGAAANGLNLVFATEYPAGTPITANQSINVSAGVATLVSMIQQPTTLVTRQTFSPDVTVELRDQFGNKVESDSSSSVSVVLYDITGQPAVATTGQPALTAISAAASQGAATFSGLGYAVAPGTGYYLRVSLGGFTISSGVFDVLPGAATSIEIDVQPSTSIGAGLTPTGELIQVMPEISLYDQDGYLATTTNGTATISATNSGDLSEGATSATVTNGQADFTGIKLVGTPGQSYSLVFAFGSATETSAAMQVTHNVATKIVVDRAAANGRSHEPFVTQPIVKVLDRYNNLVTSGSGSGLDLRVVSSGGSVSGANISASGGIGTFTGLSLGGAVNTDYTFTYEAPFNQNIATASQAGVQVGYGFASQLRIHQEPVSLSGGVLTKTGAALATQPVIHVTDNWGNIVENSTIQITASLFATQDVRDRLVSATATAVNGVATFSGLSMVVRPETDYKIKFAAGSLNKTSGNIQVRHGDATALRIITEPSSVAGQGLTMTGEVLATTPVVEAIDFDGNRATSVTGDIATATVSVGGGEAVIDLHSGGLQHNQAAFTAGVAAFQNLKVVALPGVEQKLAFNANIASTAVATPAASAGFVLTNNVANKLAVLTQPCAGNVVSASCSTGITGDTLLVQPQIEIQDRFGNRVPEWVGEVEIATSTAGSSILVSGVSNPTAQKATAVSGVATFSGIGLIALPSAQTQFSFTATNLLSTTSANVVVAAATPHKLVMATQPAGGRTGDALATQPVVHVLDRFDNHVLSDNLTVVTASIGSGAGGTLSSAAGSVTAVNGVVTFSDLVFSGVPGDNYTLSFGSGLLTSAISNAFSVTNGLAAGLNITSEPVGGKTGDLLSNLVELELLDDELNLAADDNSTVVTVAFAVTDGLASFVDSSDVTVTPSVTAVGGVVDFGDLRVVGTPGYEYKLFFTATPTSGPSYNSPQSAGFTLTHANPAAVIVTQSPVGGIVGGALATQPTLRINDRFGNHATSDNSTTVSVSIFSGTGGSIVSGGSATAVGGVVSFGAIAATGTPGELYQLRFSATAANSATFSVDDTVGFRLSKTASLTFSYAAVDYAPDAIVSPTFATDSPATPIFTTSSSASVCELVLDPTTSAPNGQIRVKGVGSCVVSVTIPNAPFYSTISATETLVINKAQQAALVITSANNVDYWSTMTPTATGGSGTGALSFLVQGDCRIIGTTLIPGNAGSPCEITARKLGDANYQIAYSDPMDLTINKISQTPLRMANANTAAMIDLALFTSGGSGTGEVTFQITTNRSVAGVEQCALVENGTRLRALSSGTCGVSATKATSTNHLVAISPEQTITFTKAEQRVNFTSSIPAMPLVGSIYTPVAVASSGLPVTYTITSGSGTICAWDTDPTKIKFLAAGACEITATQVGDGQFSQANNVQTIVVNARNQTINFAELANRAYGQPGFFLQATATSGLPVSFSVGAGSGSPACAISSGNFVNLLSAGSCEIIATQAGNQEFLAATPVKHIFTIAADLAGAPHLISISAGNQTVTASFNPPSYNGGSPITAYRLVATAANGDTYVNPGCPIGSGPVSCSLVGVPNAQPGVLNSGVYSLKVAAITIAGIGNYSMDSRAITASAGDMGVTNLIANPSVSTLTLNWDAPAALDSTFQEYEIYVWPLGGEEPETPTTTSTATSATFSTGSVAATSARRSLFSVFSGPTSIAPADAYEFKVVTITSQTQSADENLNTTFGMQQSFTIPGQPTQLQLQELPEKLSLGWSIPAFDGGKPILSYTVTVNGEPVVVRGEEKCTEISSRVCDFFDARPGMTYEFAVYASNLLGNGPVATYSISIPAPPATGNSYFGPVITHVMPNPAKPGALVLAIGSKLSVVESVAIAGIPLEFSIASDSTLALTLPANLAEGLYDLVITSSFGRLTVQDALVVSLDATSPEIDPETDPGTGSETGSGSQENSGSASSGDNDSSGSSSTDGGSSDGGSTDPGTDSQGGSEGNSGSDSGNSDGESEVPAPIDEDQSDLLAGPIGLWWIPVLALLLTLLAARRARTKTETKR